MNKEINFLIVVPTYNSYIELERLCNSLLKQNYNNWRTIFIDGDSSKAHKNWLKEISNRDKRFVIQDEKANKKGIYPSMSLGFTYANDDDWIIFLGSDDWFNINNALEKIAIKIKSSKSSIDPNLVIYETQYCEKDTQKIIRLNKVPSFKFVNKNLFSRLVFLGYIPAHQSACFSKKLLDKCMPYSEKYLLASDCNLFLKISKIKGLKIIFLKDYLINIQTGGISSKLLFRRIMEVLIIYIDHFKFYFFLPLFLRYFRRLSSRLKFYIK